MEVPGFELGLSSSQSVPWHTEPSLLSIFSKDDLFSVQFKVISF